MTDEGEGTDEGDGPTPPDAPPDDATAAADSASTPDPTDDGTNSPAGDATPDEDSARSDAAGGERAVPSADDSTRAGGSSTTDATDAGPEAGLDPADSSGTADADSAPTADPDPADPGESPSPADEVASTPDPDDAAPPRPGVPEDVRTYDRFTKIDGGTYERANDFLRDRTYITAREWAIARLCADFRTETGVEMTKIGEHLPQLVPFMTDTYTPQAVNQARAAFEDKVRKAGATFLYGAMSDFFTAEELDDVMYEATEVAKFLLEVEGVDLTVEEELAAEDTISEVMREVREHSAALRHDEVVCPECGHHIETEDA